MASFNKFNCFCLDVANALHDMKTGTAQVYKVYLTNTAPVATNTIVDAPDRYFGKLVTITAGVERMTSKTTFLMDQQKVAGAKEVKAVGKPILIIAPYLTSSLDQKKYFLVRGQVVKLEPSALAKLAPDYVLDLPQEVGAKYMGLPVLVASSVLNSTYVELAKKPIPPPTQADVALTAAMKTISPARAGKILFAIIPMAVERHSAPSG